MHASARLIPTAFIEERGMSLLSPPKIEGIIEQIFDPADAGAPKEDPREIRMEASRCPRSFYLSVAHILELSPALLARDRPVDDVTKPSLSSIPAQAACASGFSDTGQLLVAVWREKRENDHLRRIRCTHRLEKKVCCARTPSGGTSGRRNGHTKLACIVRLRPQE